MQSCELICPECQGEFKTATSLLQHFALHASNYLIKMENKNDGDISMEKKSQIPDLYPIHLYKSKLNETHLKIIEDIESDSGIEDIGPIKFCSVTMENQRDLLFKLNNDSHKKYRCNYCKRSFGWSTDLKRHALTHTLGRRPFNCHLCKLSFSRNILLQKHLNKGHQDSKKIPDLKPICAVKRKYENHVFGQQKCGLVK